MTYEEVADKAGLQGNTKSRYVAYMKARWGDEEAFKCQDGYAAEWAYRFSVGSEYSDSDIHGQAILHKIYADFPTLRRF